MPNLTPIQRGFSAGELTPRVLARGDTAFYKEGCEELENFVALAHGPLDRRGGFQFVGASDQINLSQSRLVPFQISQTESYVLLVGDLQTIVFTRYGGQGTTNHVLNGKFDEGLDNWDAVTLTNNTGAVSVVGGQCVLTPGNPANDDAGIQQEITTLTDALEYVLRFQIGGAVAGTGVFIRAGFTEGSDEIMPLQQVQPQNIDVEYTQVGTDLWIQVFAEGGDDPYTLDNVRLQEVSLESQIVVLDTPWEISRDLDLLHWEAVPSTNEIFFTHPNYAPHEIIHIAPEDWNNQDISFTGAPAEWTGDNWPGTLAFFQGRSWWGGTPARGETIWSSKSGEIRDLTVGDQDDDGIEYTVNKKGRIEWLNGAKDFLIGTEIGEHIVTAGAQVITPSDISITQQSSYGSNHAQSVQIGNRIFYISPDERKIRAMKFEFVDDGWSALDITFPSEHITLGRIRALDFAQHPENLIWMVDRRGDLIGCTYEQSNQIVGFHRHTTDGLFLDACVTEESGVSQLWVTALRLIDGVSTIFLERYDTEHHLDAHSHYNFETPVTEVDGLEYLEGQEVSILADGAVHPSRTVTAGIITLQVEALQVTIGLAYNSHFLSLPPDEDMREGAMAGYRKHWNKIWVRLLNSSLPIINGKRPPTRTPQTPMDTRQPNFTGDVKVENLGWTIRGQITVDEDLPLPCTIVGIFGEMNSSKL